MSRYLVTVERLVDAPAQQLFDLVADPARHPEIDGSTTVRAARRGNPERLGSGAHFSMAMHLGAPYLIRNTVTEFEEGRRIAWRHVNGHVWRWTFTPQPDGPDAGERAVGRPPGPDPAGAAGRGLRPPQPGAG